MSDDDNERDPFTFRYASADNLAPEYNYSDRDQRHRFNAWLLVTAKGFDFNTRISSRTAQPQIGRQHAAGAHPAGRLDHPAQHAAQGQRVLHVGLPRRPAVHVGQSVRLEPIFEIFNLTNSKNIRRPEVTNLIFNFDGTVQNGLGDPRQAQLGVRVRF